MYFRLRSHKVKSSSNSHALAFEHLKKALDLTISLLYDSYIFCFYHLIRKDKEKKIASLFDFKKKKPQEEDIWAETEPTTLEESLTTYVHNATLIFRYIMDTLSTNNFDSADERKTVELLRAALQTPEELTSKCLQPQSTLPTENYSTVGSQIGSQIYQQTSQVFNGANDSMVGRGQVGSMSSLPGSSVQPESSQIDMGMIFEYLSEEHWLMDSNVIDILRHRYLSMDDPLFNTPLFNEQISPEAIVEKVALLVVCLYAMSTETRWAETKKNSTSQKENPIVYRETAEIVARFRDFDLGSKNLDLNNEEHRSSQKQKLLKKQQEVNQKVTDS